MYLLMPLAYVAIRWRPWIVAVIFPFAVVAGLLQPIVPGLGRLNVAQFAPCFVAGFVAYALRSAATRRLPALYWPLWIGLLLAAYVTIAHALATTHPMWLAWSFCLFIGASIPMFSQIHHYAIQRTSHLVARYSYGLYLWHMLGLWLGFRVLADHNLLVQSLMAAALTILASVISYHWVEHPFIQLGNRLSARLGPRRRLAPL